MENLRNRIDLKLVNNVKDYLKRTSKPSYMSHKRFDNNLVVIPTYIGMCILELSKVLMCKLKINMATNRNCYSQILIL